MLLKSLMGLFALVATTTATNQQPRDFTSTSGNFDCPAGTNQPYVEVWVMPDYFIELTQSDNPVSGGTKIGGGETPFGFQLFDTGNEAEVKFSVWIKSNGEQPSAKAYTKVSPCRIPFAVSDPAVHFVTTTDRSKV